MSNVGLCKEHSRDFEGFCRTCNVVICPSCVIVGQHKKHDVLSLKEGAMYVREEMFASMNKGMFSKERFEEYILKIRYVKLVVEKYKAETVDLIEKAFKGMTNTVKLRKIILIHKIIDYFEEEQMKITNAKSEWELKQNLAEKINELLTLNDKEIALNAQMIAKGIKTLKRKNECVELNIYDNIDTVLKVDNNQYTIEEVRDALSEFGKILSPNSLSYKY